MHNSARFWMFEIRWNRLRCTFGICMMWCRTQRSQSVQHFCLFINARRFALASCAGRHCSHVCCCMDRLAAAAAFHSITFGCALEKDTRTALLSNVCTLCTSTRFWITANRLQSIQSHFIRRCTPRTAIISQTSGHICTSAIILLVFRVAFARKKEEQSNHGHVIGWVISTLFFWVETGDTTMSSNLLRTCWASTIELNALPILSIDVFCRRHLIYRFPIIANMCSIRRFHQVEEDQRRSVQQAQEIGQ